jgi:hypothetical protein
MPLATSHFPTNLAFARVEHHHRFPTTCIYLVSDGVGVQGIVEVDGISGIEPSLGKIAPVIEIL